MKNEIKPKRMRITLEANVIIDGDSVTLYRGGTKLLNAEPIDNSSEGQEKE